MTSSAPVASPAGLLELPADGRWDWGEVFGRRAPVVLEVGSGKGLFLAMASSVFPDRDFLGVELRRKRVEKIAAKIAGLPNARVASGDIRIVLSAVAPASLSACWINFPDPWPKRRHAGRRLLQGGFLDAVACALAPGGELAVCTDEGWFAGEILLALDACAGLANSWGNLSAAPRPAGYPVSIHEAKFRDWGRPVYFIRALRRG